METTAKPSQAVSLLLVDDEKVNLELLTAVLARRFPGVAIHTAVNGRAGLDLFKTHAPEIVITDIKMPEMGGVQMTEEIRALRPDTKIIVITGDAGGLEGRDLEENELKVDHFIVKPVAFKKLFEAIDQCLGEIAGQLP